MEMTPHSFISGHPREHLQVIYAKDVLSTCHGNPNIIPDTKGSGVNLLLLLIPSPWLLMPGSKLLNWRGRQCCPHHPRGRNGRKCCKNGGTYLRYTERLSPNGRQGLVFLVPHPGIHVFVKLHPHFCKRRTLVNIYPSTKGSILMNLTLTLFSFNIYDTQHIGGWVRA